MPLFIKSKLLLIHIPKSGGTSIENLLLENGESMSMFTATGSIFINGHTPQHCTFLELQQLGLVNNDTRIFAVVRDPVQRTVSDYFYLQKHRPDIAARCRNFDGFLDLFLKRKNNAYFDNHNLSNSEYLRDETGKISDKVTIFKYFDVEGIEEFIKCRGLRDKYAFRTDKEGFIIKDHQVKRITWYFAEDYKNFDYDL